MKCFACDKKLLLRWFLAVTSDGQRVFVGSNCWRYVLALKNMGYTPKTGGPQLFPCEIEGIVLCKSHGAIKCSQCRYDGTDSANTLKGLK